MRALVVYCHPIQSSFTAAVRDVVLDRLKTGGAETRLLDLHQDGFDPRMSAEEMSAYYSAPDNTQHVTRYLTDLAWCDTLIFVYPTWWYGLPATLKGWLDKVFLPGIAFLLPDEHHRTIRPNYTNITHLAVFTTCGASRWLNHWVGLPGRRTILRGLGILCARRCRTTYCAQHLMDSATPEIRRRHLVNVAAKVDRMIARG
ncbi:MAG: NAD(P)H-dependent oxidoreductase [Pseudomonadota bacterium]